MIRILLTLFVLIPGLAAAQPVTIRGGEHGAFTRLVFTLSGVTDWAVTQDPETGAIAVTLNGAQVDASEAFDRINRDRIADIRVPEAGRVDIDLACNCVPESFTVDDSLLVIDVAAAPEGVNFASDQAPARDPETAALLAELSRVHLDATPGLGPRRVDRDLGSSVDPMLPGAREILITPRLPRSDPNLLPGSDLAERLASAASSGVLTPARVSGQAARRTDPVGPVSAAEDHFVGGPAASLQNDLAASMQTLSTTADAGRIEIGDDRCEADLDLASWAGDDAEDASALMARRGMIYGEFDKTREGAVEDYVRGLLFLGFGAEARAALDSVQTGGTETLRALSYLVDGQSDPTGRFMKSTTCEGPAAFWALISLPVPEDVQAVDTAAILTAFEALPLHLRVHLGPKAAENLSQAGYPSAAHDLLRRLARSRGETDEEILIGQTRIDLDHGAPEKARDRLAQLPSPSAQGQEAVIAAQVAIAEATGGGLTDRVADLAETYAVEARNTDRSDEAWSVHLRAMILADRWAEAYVALSSARDVPSPERADVQALFLTRLTEQAPDYDFLRFGLGLAERRSVTLSSDLGLAMTRRLLDTGLHDAALTLIDRLPPQTDPELRSLAEAEGHLGLGEPAEAEIALIGLRGDAAERLRAEARRQMGDHDLAKDLFRGLDDLQNAATSAWLSGDWDAIGSEEESAFTETARLVATSTGDFDPRTEGLAAIRQLAEESRNSRTILQQLIAATPVE